MSVYRIPAEPQEEELDDEAFVTIFRPTDPVEADLIEQILRDENIVSRTIGTRDGMLVGVPQFVHPLRIEVPRPSAERAQELIQAYREPPDADGESAPEAAPDEAPREYRRVILAVGATMLFFGGAHVYIRRPWTASILAIVQLSAVIAFFRSSGDWPDRTIAAATMLGVLVTDAVFAARAVAPFNRGERPDVKAQLRTGVLFCAAIAMASAAAAWGSL